MHIFDRVHLNANQLFMSFFLLTPVAEIILMKIQIPPVSDSVPFRRVESIRTAVSNPFPPQGIKLRNKINHSFVPHGCRTQGIDKLNRNQGRLGM